MKNKKTKLTKQQPTSLNLLADAIELTEQELEGISGGELIEQSSNLKFSIIK